MHDLEKSRLLSKLFSEELNTAEKESLDSWLTQSKDNAAEKETLQRIWNLSGNYEPTFEADLDKGLNKFQQRIQQDEATTNSPKIIRMRPGRLLVRVAAVFLLLLTATFLIKPDILSNKESIYASAEEIANSNLADGSEIWLNKNSSLKYDKDFGKETRNVYLKGEAFFDVRPDKSKPFIITTEKTRITVLGTSFNVREDQIGDTYLDVKTGLVSFESLDNSNSVQVKAGESAVYNSSNQSITHQVSATNNADSWLDSRFSFNSTPLVTVFEDLARHYNVNFTIMNKDIEQCPYTSGEFESKSVEQMIEVLESAFPIQIEKTAKDNYEIKGSRCI